MASVVSGCVEGVFEQIRRVWHPFLVEEGFPTTVPAGGHCARWRARGPGLQLLVPLAVGGTLGA